LAGADPPCHPQDQLGVAAQALIIRGGNPQLCAVQCSGRNFQILIAPPVARSMSCKIELSRVIGAALFVSAEVAYFLFSPTLSFGTPSLDDFGGASSSTLGWADVETLHTRVGDIETCSWVLSPMMLAGLLHVPLAMPLFAALAGSLVSLTARKPRRTRLRGSAPALAPQHDIDAAPARSPRVGPWPSSTGRRREPRRAWRLCARRH
jgi:hypothetical protein